MKMIRDCQAMTSEGPWNRPRLNCSTQTHNTIHNPEKLREARRSLLSHHHHFKFDVTLRTSSERSLTQPTTAYDHLNPHTSALLPSIHTTHCALPSSHHVPHNGTTSPSPHRHTLLLHRPHILAPQLHMPRPAHDRAGPHGLPHNRGPRLAGRRMDWRRVDDDGEQTLLAQQRCEQHGGRGDARRRGGLGGTATVDEEESREAVFHRLEALGYRVGLGIVER